ncbi:MAG: FAD-dependent oxidoreductase [Pseudomonadota bacterium]|nr:FAD-dependent oxidoreductase [Pseudomonadota bacterium]
MRIAVIGSGIAGLASAHLLSREHDVVLFEANDYLGGHTHTHDIALHGRQYRIDTGFIVFNPDHYPLLSRLFGELGVVSQPTTMSFSVRNEASGLEYNASDLDSLFCQRRNLVSPRFLGMVRDLFRFYRQAPALLQGAGPGPSIGDYLDGHGYGAAFRDEHLVPMASALWSSPSAEILRFPARYLVQFMANHQMLQVADRPQWRVVQGGSNRYVQALRERWSVSERLRCPVHAILRDAEGVQVDSAAGSERFDQVVLACHSDQALALLADADARERAILGAMPYQLNETVLHTDASVLPRNRKAWAAWNAHLPRDPAQACTVSYCMNLLQGIDSPDTFVVTLNRGDEIDPGHVLRRMRYHHPVYSQASVAAQARKAEIQGRRHTWFAGAYWGWGFHEDGMRSAVDVAAGLGVRWAPGSTSPAAGTADAPGAAQAGAKQAGAKAWA